MTQFGWKREVDGRLVRPIGVRSTGDLRLLFFLSTFLLVPLPWSFLFAPLTAYLGQGPGVK